MASESNLNDRWVERWAQSDKWFLTGVCIFIVSIFLAIIGYISGPPNSLQHVKGEVLSTYVASRGKGGPKFNIVVSYGQPQAVILYIESEAIKTKIHPGDVIEVQFESDIIGRNWHRMWDLHRGDEVILSKEALMNEASDGMRIGLWSALFAFVLSLVPFGVGLWLRPTPDHE